MKKGKKRIIKKNLKKPKNLKNLKKYKISRPRILNRVSSKIIKNKAINHKIYKSRANKSSRKLFIIIILSLAFVALILAFSFLFAQKLVNPLNQINSSENIALAILSDNKDALYIKFNLDEKRLSNLSFLNFTINKENGKSYSYYTPFVRNNSTFVLKNNFVEDLLRIEETDIKYDYVLYVNNVSNIKNFEDILNVSVDFFFSNILSSNTIKSNPLIPKNVKPPIVSPPQQNTPPSNTEEESPCVPNCTGKQCGSNGCGGSCGNCGSDEKCSQNQCIPDCIEGNWTNTSEYRCNLENNTIREIKQVKDLCPRGTNETWIKDDCIFGEVCYSGEGHPIGLCINNNLTCNKPNNTCIDNKNLSEFYCFYNQSINNFEINNNTIVCDGNGGCYDGACFECIDADLDGYNLSYSNTSLLCGDLSDCDDNNQSIYPNATEICGNNIDENCNGIYEECGTGSESELASSSILNKIIEWFKNLF